MDVNIVSKSVEASFEDQRSVHKGAWVNQAASFLYDHLLNIKDEATIENLESDCTLTSKYHYLIVIDLMSKTHVAWNPLGLVSEWGLDFLPHISLDVIDFNGVQDSLLVNSATKGKEILVFEGAESYARPWNLEVCDLLPFILLGIVSLAVSVHLVVNKCTYYVNEAFDSTN